MPTAWNCSATPATRSSSACASKAPRDRSITVTTGSRPSPSSIKASPIAANEIHLPVSNPRRTEDKSKFYVPDHVRDFLLSVKSRKDPIEPVEIGHHMTNICHLGNIAMLLNRKLPVGPGEGAVPRRRGGQRHAVPADARAVAALECVAVLT